MGGNFELAAASIHGFIDGADEVHAASPSSLIHLLMFGEVAVPLLAAMFLNINALITAIMIAAFFLHEATALWDASYATTARTLTPIEQHVHSFLEMIPLVAIVSAVSLHWEQFIALFGVGSELARFDIDWKSEPLPASWLSFCCSNCFHTSRNLSAACARTAAG